MTFTHQPSLRRLSLATFTLLSALSLTACSDTTDEADAAVATATGKADDVTFDSSYAVLNLTLPPGTCNVGQTCDLPLTDNTIMLDGKALQLGPNTVRAKVYELPDGVLDLSQPIHHHQMLRVVRFACPPAHPACVPQASARLTATPNQGPEIVDDPIATVDVRIAPARLPGDIVRMGQLVPTGNTLLGPTHRCEGIALDAGNHQVMIPTQQTAYLCTEHWYMKLGARTQPYELGRIDVNPITFPRPDGTMHTVDSDFWIDGTSRALNWWSALGLSMIDRSPPEAPLGTGLWMPKGSYRVHVVYEDATGNVVSSRQDVTLQ